MPPLLLLSFPSSLFVRSSNLFSFLRKPILLSRHSKKKTGRRPACEKKQTRAKSPNDGHISHHQHRRFPNTSRSSRGEEISVINCHKGDRVNTVMSDTSVCVKTLRLFFFSCPFSKQQDHLVLLSACDHRIFLSLTKEHSLSRVCHAVRGKKVQRIRFLCRKQEFKGEK
jgi:hypothetical protein